MEAATNLPTGMVVVDLEYYRAHHDLPISKPTMHGAAWATLHKVQLSSIRLEQQLNCPQ